MGAYDAKNDRWSLLYLGKAQIRRVEAGEIEVVGRAADSSVILGPAEAREVRTAAKTVWNRPSHRAGEYGTLLNRALLPGRRFPFPKSLYAVEDALRVVVGDKPRAVVLDFFAGSGTTAHAVFRLNRQDGGSRQSIIVTNNEVSADEQKQLWEQGLRPGDERWEQNGICEYITKPRIESAIIGLTPEGDRIEGDYRFIDSFPMAEGFAENLEAFRLTYESAMRIANHREFERVSPLLWLRAGARGRRVVDLSAGWDVAEAYGVLASLDCTEQFVAAVESQEALTHAFIVTDEDRLFESIVRQLPEHVESVRLYSSYIRNFEIEIGRSVR